MAKRVQLVRHDSAGAAAFTGLIGEITVNTTNNSLIVHNGVTLGGFELARSDLNNVANASAITAGKMTAAQVTELTNATANVATNTANIATNTGNIATNTANIATNTSDIATNIADIAALDAALTVVDGFFTANVLNIANGGTGGSTATFARQNLGVEIGINVQAWNSNLDLWALKTLPSGSVVGTTDAQTLTNKTLTAPIISSISNSGTVTFPTGTRTLVARDTTDTLTNKTLTSPVLNTPTLTSPVLNTSVSGTAVLDEDNMASNSATQLATQQSIKAYVDSQISSGSWTPTLQDTSYSDAEGQTYSMQTAGYYRIGNLVFVHGRIALSSLGTLSGSLFLAGLPFTAATGYPGTIHVGVAQAMALTNNPPVQATVAASSTRAQLNVWFTTSGITALTVTQVTATFSLIFSGCYVAA